LSHHAFMAGNLGAALRRARKRLDLSQEDLAGRIGVTRRTLGEWERQGKIPARHLERLAGELDEDWLREAQADDGEAAGNGADPTPEALTVITAGGLVIRIQPAPGARLEDVIARQNEIVEIVAKRLAELDADEE
jgi:transcriptional regulator with XRE-family HTH domain